MSAAHGRTASQDISDSMRKRVCKACDRCRLKKSKCDGSNPCTRCRADNAICVFGERKKSHDKVYPKGYVEMLEQQQGQLVQGLQAMYSRMLAANLFPNGALKDNDGQPLTHDILAALGILKPHAGEDEDAFEEDPEKLQQRLLSRGAPYMPRRGSFSSESNEEQSPLHSHKRSRSHADSPAPSSNKAHFRRSFDFNTLKQSPRPSSSPVIHQSPLPMSSSLHPPIKPSPLHNESPVQNDLPPLDDDVLLSSYDWQAIEQPFNPRLQPQFNLQLPPKPRNTSTPAMSMSSSTQPSHTSMDSWSSFDTQVQYDMNMMNNYPTQTPMNMADFQDWPNDLPSDFDFSKYVQVAT